MTGGRTRAERRDLRVETLLQTTVDGGRPSPSHPEQAAILRACTSPISVAEVAAGLNLVLGVVTVLAGDLIADGLLEVHQTDPVEIELDALTRMLERVRASDIDTGADSRVRPTQTTSPRSSSSSPAASASARPPSSAPSPRSRRCAPRPP